MPDARALLSEVAVHGPPREIDADIFELAPPTAPAHYDRMGWLYDAVCGTTLYNRVVWGTTPDRSRAFAERVFASRRAGPHVEIGCGALLFSAPLYDADRGRPVLLVDQSLAMLRMARARLRRRTGRVPPYVALVRADGRELPFVRGFATTVLSMHVLHVVHERPVFLRQLASLAAPRDGTIGLTSLVRTGSLRDGLLSLLHRAGELSPPVDMPALDQLVRASWAGPVAIERAGNMAFVSGTAAP